MIAKRNSGRKFRDVHPYKCDHCGGWHIGHRPKAIQRAINQSREAKGNWSRRLSDLTTEQNQ